MPSETPSAHRPGDTAAASFGARGSNQSGMRAHNERLVLSLVRRHGALSKAEIARATGLSAQTVSVIMRGLEAEGLLVKGDPVRGRVGQPSVPMRLVPGGAYFFGLKIGRRSTELILLNFTGDVVGRCRASHRYPAPDDTLAFVADGVAELRAKLPPGAARRIGGFGVAMPFQLWEWADDLGDAEGAMDEWQRRDIRAELAEMLHMPVVLQNDATSACGAELVFGHAPAEHFLYFYVGTFIGGGVVLNGNLFAGPNGNAGALGSMPVPGRNGGPPRQLIDVASLDGLERVVIAAGGDGGAIWSGSERWDLPEAPLNAWIEGAAAGIAHAVLASVSVIDFPVAMIDGWLPAAVRARLVTETGAALDRLNLAGLARPEIVEGRVGADARTIGAASLPLSERYMVDNSALLKHG